jgi:hypothetical protein
MKFIEVYLNKYLNNKGAALVWALILIVIVIILSGSMLLVSRQDILETDIHETRLKTYFVALAGTDIGYAALMENSGTKKYIDLFVDNDDITGDESDVNKVVTDNIDIEDNGVVIGTAVVTLDSVLLDSKRWVRVTSVGTLAGETLQVRSVIRINAENYTHIIRED